MDGVFVFNGLKVERGNAENTAPSKVHSMTPFGFTAREHEQENSGRRENITRRSSPNGPPFVRCRTCVGVFCKWLFLFLSSPTTNEQNRTKNIYIIFRVININIISWFFFCFLVRACPTCETLSDAIVDIVRYCTNSILIFYQFVFFFFFFFSSHSSSLVTARRFFHFTLLLFWQRNFCSGTATVAPSDCHCSLHVSQECTQHSCQRIRFFYVFFFVSKKYFTPNTRASRIFRLTVYGTYVRK